MTKIGDQKIVQVGARGAEAGTGTRQEQLSFARSLSRAAPVHPMAIGLGASTGQSMGISETPPAYDAMQNVAFSTVSRLVAAQSPEAAAEVGALANGLASGELPNVVIIATPGNGGANEIVSVGRNIFVPSPVFAQWQADGKADAHGAQGFNAAFSAVLARTAAHNS